MFSHFFIERPIFSSVLSIVILLVGGVSLIALPIARYPEIAPPTIVVEAAYPGATAETIADTVATPIEQEVNGVEGMLYMTSTSSSDGSMELTVTFDQGIDLDIANVLVQNRVALAEPLLPEEVRRLGVSTSKRSSDILVVMSLVSPNGTYNDTFLNNFANVNIRDELTRIDGVSEVELFGSSFGMRVWLEPDRMMARNLTTNDIVAAIREQNVQVAAGKIGEAPAPAGQAFELTVDTQGRLEQPQEFENLVVKVGEDGRMIRLHEVARVELGSQAYAINATQNGVPTAAMAVYQLPGANAVAVADAVVAKMAELSALFPEDVEYRIPYDGTAVIRASIEEVVFTLFITLSLVVITVFMFLQDWRATLIPAVTIPVSLIGTFAVMLMMGYSLNILTLFALVLVIGIVVDDAIVVVENVSRLIDEGKTPREAARQSMVEVTGPVVATTLVLLSVFVPTIFMGGIVGELFRQFAVTISIATVFSSMNALTLSPALCAILLRPKRPTGAFNPFGWFEAGFNGLRWLYGGSVKLAIRIVPVTLVLFIGSVVIALWSLSQVPSGFVPQEDEGWFLVNVQLPDAAALGRTEKLTQEIVANLQQIPAVADIVMVNGLSLIDNSRAGNAATAFVVLKPWDERGPDEHLMLILGQVNGYFSTIQEAIAIGFPPPSLPGIGFAGGFMMQLQDKGRIGPQELEKITYELVGAANMQSGLNRVFSTYRANTPQLYLNIDREQVKSMGISLQAVFDTLAAYLGSVYVNDFTLLGRTYQVLVQADATHRATPEDIRKLELRTPAGSMIPLGTIMEVEETLGPRTITHFNIYPTARINGEAAPGFSSGEAMDLMTKLANQTLPQSMGFAWTDLSFQEQRATGGSAGIYIFAVIMVYLVLAAQYESWSIPFAVVLGVPAALLGAAIAVLWQGFDNNVYTQIGIVLLIGLAAKTAILIVEFARAQRMTGNSIRESALTAARLRFRAVLMTAFSFILGVIPLVIATGAGAASRQVLGLVVFSGMLVSTLIGVIAVPALYFVIQHFSEWIWPVKKAQQPAAEVTS